MPLHDGRIISYEEQLVQYEHELMLLREAMDADPENKFSDIHQIFFHKRLNRSIRIDDSLEKIRQYQGESDFSITPLIRCLYLSKANHHQPFQNRIQAENDIDSASKAFSNLQSPDLEETDGAIITNIDEQHPEIDALCDDIVEALRIFPFWPSTDKGMNSNMDDLVFWSENHLFMTLGSAFLFYQYMRLICPPNLEESNFGTGEGVDARHTRLRGVIDRTEDNDCKAFNRYRELLIVYLKIHTTMNGFFEVNSPVYIPYSIAALWNLYDFSYDEEVRNAAKCVVDRMISQVMFTTDPLTGIVNLSATARNYPRFRQRNFNHTINHLIKVLNHGVNTDSYSRINFLSGFLVTTTWKPSYDIFQALQSKGSVCVAEPFNVNIADVHQMFKNVAKFESLENFIETMNIDWVPFLWSAGLVTHPDFVHKTTEFMDVYGLGGNKHLWALLMFGKSITGSVMNHMTHFSSGQVYLDMKLNVYKRPGLVLSSFELYNPHKCGFQQSPWMANIGGVPVWSRSGRGAESVAGFGIHNTHNPAVQQRGNVLLVSYAAPNILQGWVVGGVFSPKVYLMWPATIFDEIGYGIVSRSFCDSRDKIISAPAASHSLFTFPSLSFSRPVTAIDQFSSSSSSENSTFPDLKNILASGEHIWMIGRKGGAYIACHITKGSSTEDRGAVLKVNDSLDAKDVYFQCDASNTSKKDSITRISTDAKNVSIVVVVGSQSQYPSIERFVDRCLLQISIHDDGKVVHVHSAQGHDSDADHPSIPQQQILKYEYPS